MKIAIIGAGGHSRSLINLLQTNSYLIDGFYDNNGHENELISGYSILGTIDTALNNNTRVVLAIGDNDYREKLHIQFRNKILKETLVHPTAYIENLTKIGDSNQIFAFSYINAHASIGTNNIINTHAIIEHEVQIGNNNHCAVGSIICGRVKIGNNCFIGAGAVLIDNISITDNVTIGAQSVVINDITEPGVYVGNPVRKIK